MKIINLVVFLLLTKRDWQEMYRYPIIIVLALFPLILLGQQFSFKNYTNEDGLSKSEIFTIYEDSKGYIWIATDAGINKFDGFNFESFSFKDGLLNNQIRTIFEDNKQNIWIGLKDGYIAKYDGDKFINYKKEDGLIGKTVLSIAQDIKGNILAGTENNGLFILENDKFKPIPLDDKELLISVTSLITKDSTLWIGTKRNGVFVLNENNLRKYSKSNGLPSNNINEIYKDNADKIWIATNNGISSYDGRRFYNYNQTDGICDNRITCILNDAQGDYWLGTYGHGICKFDGKNFISINESNGLPNNYVVDILQDRNGKIWLGFENSGISKFHGEQFKHFTTSEGLTGDITTAICEDRNNDIWVSIFGSGICKLQNNKFQLINESNGLFSSLIQYIYEDATGNMWFLSKNNGISKYDGKSFTNYSTSDGLVSNNIIKTIEDSKNNLWFISKESGLSIFDGENFTNFSSRNGLLSDILNDIYKDDMGNIWLASDNSGIQMIFSIIDPDTIISSKWLHKDDYLNIGEKFNLTHDKISCINQDNYGGMWFGTIGKGILKFDGNSFTEYTVNDNLNSNNIYFILPDSKDYIWTGTEKGINRLEFKGITENPIIRSFGYDEGFRGIETNNLAAIEDKNGLIWIGTKKGLTQYNPSRDHINKIEPHTQITSIDLFYEKVDWETYADTLTAWYNLPKSLILPYNKNHLTFKFLGIDLVAPDKVKYRWKLEGFDKEWSHVSNKRNVTYSYLPDGDYKFIIASVNNDGVWSHSEEFSFIITPPIWKTWWFIILLILSLGAMAYTFFKWRIRTIEKENKILEEKVDDRTKALRKEKQTVEKQAKHLELVNTELEKLSIVASETDNSVIIFDNNGAIEWVNHGFKKLRGYNIDELVKKCGSNHIFEISNHPKIEDYFNKCITEQVSVSYASEAETKHNGNIWVQTTLTPILDASNEIKQLVAIDADITVIKKAEETIKLEKEKSDTLLLNILPGETAEELKEKGTATPRKYRKVSVLFTDFKDFSINCEGLSPDELVSQLHQYFVKFDSISESHVIEKIKTIGDAYMCAGGIPIRNKSHPIDSVLAGMEMVEYMREINTLKIKNGESPWELRVGIHTGQIIAGVVGLKKFAYDIWGETVNIASRVETNGLAGKVNISASTHSLVNEYFDCEYRGKIDAKNVGEIDMYFVVGIKESLSIDGKGKLPNREFQRILSEL